MGLLDSINDKKPGGTNNPSDSTLLGSSELASAGTDLSRVNLDSTTKLQQASQPEPPKPAEAPKKKEEDKGVIASFTGAIAHDTVGLLGATKDFFYNTDGKNTLSATGDRASLASLGGSGMGASVMRSIGGISHTVGVLWEKPEILTTALGNAKDTLTSGSASDRASLLGHTVFFVGTMAVGGGGAAKAKNLLGDVRAAGVVSEGALAGDLALTNASRLQRIATGEGLTSELAMSRLSSTASADVLSAGAGWSSRVLPMEGGASFLTTARAGMSKLPTTIDDLTAATVGVRNQATRAWEIARDQGSSLFSRFRKGGSTVDDITALGGSSLDDAAKAGKVFDTPASTRLTELVTTPGPKNLSVLDGAMPVAQDGLATLKGQAITQVETHVGDIGRQIKALREMQSGNTAVQEALTFIETNAGKNANLADRFAVVEKALGGEATAGLKASMTRLEQSSTVVQNLSTVENAFGNFTASSERVLQTVGNAEKGPLQQVITQFGKGEASVADVQAAISKLAVKEPELAAQLTRSLAPLERELIQSTHAQNLSRFGNTVESTLAEAGTGSRVAARELQQAWSEFGQGKRTIDELRVVTEQFAKSEPALGARLTQELNAVQRSTMVVENATAVQRTGTVIEATVAEAGTGSQATARQLQQVWSEFGQGKRSIDELKVVAQQFAKEEPVLGARVTQELNAMQKTTAAVEHVGAVERTARTIDAVVAEAGTAGKTAARELQQAWTEFGQGKRSIDELKVVAQQFAKEEPALGARVAQELNTMQKTTAAVEQVGAIERTGRTIESIVADTQVGAKPIARELQQAWSEFGQGKRTVDELKVVAQQFAKEEPALGARVTQELNAMQKSTMAVEQATAVERTGRTIESIVADTQVGAKPIARELQQAWTEFGQGKRTVDELKVVAQQFAKEEPVLGARVTQELNAVQKSTAAVEQMTAVERTGRSIEAALSESAAGGKVAARELQQAWTEFGQGKRTVDELKVVAQQFAKEEPVLGARVTQELNAMQKSTAAVEHVAAVERTGRTIETVVAETGTGGRAAANELKQVWTEFGQGRRSMDELKAAAQQFAKEEPALGARVTQELNVMQKSTATVEHITAVERTGRSIEAIVADSGATAKAATRDLQQAWTEFNQGRRSVEELKVAAQQFAKEEPVLGARLTQEVNAMQKTSVAVEQVTAVERTGRTIEAALAESTTGRAAARELQQAWTEFGQGKRSIEELKIAAQQFAKEEPVLGARVTQEIGAVQRTTVAAERVKAVESVGATLEASAPKVLAENQAALRNVEQVWTKYQEGSATSQQLKASIEALSAKEPQVGAQLAREIAQAEKVVAQSNKLANAELAANSLRETSAFTSTAVRESSASVASKIETMSADAKLAAGDAQALKSMQQSMSKLSVDGPGAMAEIKSTMQTLSPKLARELEPAIANMDNAVNYANRLKATERALAGSQEASAALLSKTESVAKTASAADLEAMNAFRQGASRVVSGADNSAAIAEMRTSLRAMDARTAGELSPAVSKLETASAKANAELFDLHGNKLTQNLQNLRETGNLGTAAQIERMEAVKRDLQVMKSLVPQESATYQQLLKLDKNMAGMESISNILAHREVARAGYKELLKLAGSSDASIATAAADKLILNGKAGAIGDSPVLGLISERQKFWSTQNEILEAERASKLKLLISGRVEGLSREDMYIKQLVSDRRWAAVGLPILIGDMFLYQKKIRDGVESILEQQMKAAGAAAAQAKTNDQAAGNNGARTESTVMRVEPGKDASGRPTDTQRSAVQAENVNRQGAMERTSYTNTTNTTASNQAVFRSNPDEVRVPVIAKFVPQEQPESVRHSFVNTNGKDWWWLANQHGGNWHGYQRGPGAPPVVEVAQPQQVAQQQIKFRTGGSSQTSEPENRVKIAPGGFTTKNSWEIRIQSDLFTDIRSVKTAPGQISAIGYMGTAPVTSLQNTIAGLTGGRVGTTEGRRGHDHRHLGPLEKGEEVSLDAPGAGSAASSTDPDPASGSTVMAQSNQDDEQGQGGQTQPTIQVQGTLAGKATTAKADDESDALINRV